METSSIVGLISALGASGAAVFVCWFLTTSFLTRQKEQQDAFASSQKEQKECTMKCQDELLALAKDKGEVLRQNALAMDRLSGLISQMITILKKIEHDVPPGELVRDNTQAIDRLEKATESLVSGLRFAAEHLPPSTVAVPAVAVELIPKAKSKP